MKLRISLASLLLIMAIVAIPIADRVSQVRERDRVLQYVIENAQCQALLDLHGNQAEFVEGYSQTRISTARSMQAAAIGEDASWLTRTRYENSYGIQQLFISIQDATQAARWSDVLSQRRAARGLQVLALHLKDSKLPFDFRVLANMDDVRVLTLTKVDIDRKLLDALLNMNDLEIIDLSGCSIADFNQLCCLSQKPNLAWLKIDGSLLSDEEVKQLRRQLPYIYLNI